MNISFEFSLPSLNNIQVRQLNSDDLNSIKDIERRSHDLPWSKKNVLSSLTSSHHCAGLWLDEKLLGYAIWTEVVDQAELLLLVIDRVYWGKGIAGRYLQEQLLRFETCITNVFLEVRESNERAIALYESVGFNQIGERPNYYPPVSPEEKRETALIYAMDLSAVKT